MAQVLEHILLCFAVLTAAFSGILISGENKKFIENRLCFIFGIGSSIWSLFFGLLMVQTDPEAAMLCRTIGLFGTFVYLFFANALLVRLSHIKGAAKTYVRAFALLGVVIYPFNALPRAATFFPTDYGMSYVLNSDYIPGVIYAAYTVIIAINMTIMIIMMMQKNRKQRDHALAKRLMLCMVIIALGMVADTILPQFGFTAVPGSTITQFFGALAMMAVIKYSNFARMTLSNMSKFVYYSLNVPVLIYDDFRNLCIVNSSAAETFGIKEDADNLTLSDLFDVDTDSLRPKNGRMSVEAQRRGSDMYCNLDINEIYDDFNDVIGYIVIVTDLTEKIHFINDLEKARDEANRANSAKSVFLANMSHEIRTPINGMLGMNELIIRESGEKEILGYAKKIKSSGKTLMRLINDILDFSRVESGRMEIVPAEYSTKDMLNGALALFTYSAQEKGIKLHVEAETTLPAVLYGDEARLRQILVNLLGNAVKYTEVGDVWFRVKCINDDADDKNSTPSDEIIMHFEVEDTGIGIREEDIEELFLPFKRFDARKNRNIEGTGLGLGIASRLSDMMDGKLSVRSSYQKGSCFCFDVKQRVISSEPMGSIEAVEYEEEETVFAPSFTAAGASILIVDDNETNIEVLKGLLKGTKLHIDSVTSGRECINAVQKRIYSIILLDHMMTEMDGIETLKQLHTMEKNLSHDAAVVALTANAITGAREFYLEQGFDDYIPKPVEFRTLERVLKRYLPEQLVIETADRKYNMDELEISGDKNLTDMKVRSELSEGGINLEEGLIYCRSIDVYISTAKSFCGMCGDITSNLKIYFENQDMRNYRVLVHGIKSNARTLGAEKLYKLAFDQERRCEGEKGRVEWKDMQLMLEEIVTTVELLSRVLFGVGGPGYEGRRRLSAGEQMERLSEMIKFADNFDDEGILRGASEIETFDLDDDLADCMRQVKKYMLVYKYAETSALLKTQLTKLINEGRQSGEYNH